MTALSPSAKRRAGRRFTADERPCYAQRPIVPSVTVTFPLPPTTNSLFANVVGRGRIKTPRYRQWRQQAVLAISIATPRPGRIAGLCDVEIRLPPFHGDTDNRVKPCLDAAKEAGIIADDGARYVRNVNTIRDKDATTVRMTFTCLPVEEQDAVEIEVRAREGQSPVYIATALGLSVGQVETTLAGARP